MIKVLGLHNNNLRRYLEDYVEEDLKLFNLITLYHTTVTLSNSFIRFNTRGFPSLLISKEKALRLMLENSNLNLRNLDNITVENMNPDSMEEVFSLYTNIEVIQEISEDIDLCNRFLLKHNKEQLREKMVKYNRDTGELSAEEVRICSELATMAELRLIKEMSILRFKKGEGLKDTVYTYLSVDLSDNKMQPILNVLDLYTLSPHNRICKDKCVYNKYALTITQLFNILSHKYPKDLIVTKEVFNYNVNSEFIEGSINL